MPKIKSIPNWIRKIVTWTPTQSLKVWGGVTVCMAIIVVGLSVLIPTLISSSDEMKNMESTMLSGGQITLAIVSLLVALTFFLAQVFFQNRLRKPNDDLGKKRVLIISVAISMFCARYCLILGAGVVLFPFLRASLA